MSTHSHVTGTILASFHIVQLYRELIVQGIFNFGIVSACVGMAVLCDWCELGMYANNSRRRPDH